MSINLPMSPALPACHQFCCIIFSFSFISKFFFLISLEIYSLTYHLFRSTSFHFYIFVNFLLLLISNFILLWLENILCMVSVISNVLRLVLWPTIWSILKDIQGLLEENVFFCYCWVECSLGMYILLFKSSLSLLIFS